MEKNPGRMKDLLSPSGVNTSCIHTGVVVEQQRQIEHLLGIIKNHITSVMWHEIKEFRGVFPWEKPGATINNREYIKNLNKQKIRNNSYKFVIFVH